MRNDVVWKLGSTLLELLERGGQEPQALAEQFLEEVHLVLAVDFEGPDQQAPAGHQFGQAAAPALGPAVGHAAFGTDAAAVPSAAGSR